MKKQLKYYYQVGDIVTIRPEYWYELLKDINTDNPNRDVKVHVCIDGRDIECYVKVKRLYGYTVSRKNDHVKSSL